MARQLPPGIKRTAPSRNFPKGGYEASYRAPGGREVTKTFERLLDATRWKAAGTIDKARGEWIDPTAGRVTFKAAAEQWRAVQVHRPGTARSAEQQLRLHVYPVIGARPIADIRQSEIQGLVRRMGEQLAPGTVEVTYGRVVAVFRSAVRDRLIASSPCVDITLPSKPPASTLQVLEREQVAALALAVPARYRGLVVAGAGTGLRPSELFGLTVDRIDFLKRVVRVDRQLVRVKGGVDFGPLKTQASYRTVPLGQTVVGALAAHLAEWPAHPDLGLVFTSDRSGPVQQHPFASTFDTARTRAKLPAWATPHDLRHYFASVLIRSGASVKVVQARLGHASAKTTLDTYGHLFADEEDRTRAAIDAEFGGIAGWTRGEATG